MEDQQALSLDAPRLRAVRMGTLAATQRRMPDGTIYVEPVEALGPYPRAITDRLDHWARETPDAVFLADRGDDGQWRRITYAAAWEQVRRLASALLPFGLSPDHPLLILSGNEIEHALIGFAAMLIGVPYAPLSPNYSLVSKDFAKLKHVVGLLEPGLVYASDGARFAAAIDAAIPSHTPLVVRRYPPVGRVTHLFEALSRTPVAAAVDEAAAALTPEIIAKFLFTSGSTGMPKAVITTQRMLTSNQQMIRTALAFLSDEPPVLVDWSPWNHTAGGSHNVGIALYNGGALYIDDGLPTPDGIGRTVRNLEEIAPTVYFNVPKGYEMLVPHLESNRRLRQTFFSRLKVMQYAGAGLSQHVWDGLHDAALSATGERILMITGYGSTETAPFAFSTTAPVEKAGTVGLPSPGLRVKLVPDGEKLELRVKGPNVTPGYWKQPEVTAKTFDDEGYYKIGDALRYADPDDLAQGFLFDGRVTEDFKLSTGTWVNLAAVRGAIIAACSGLIRDVVLTGLDRNHIGALIFPSPGTAPDRAAFEQRLAALAKTATGSSTHVARAIVLETPPQIDWSEVTDKGSINQRAVMAARAAEVEDLYREPPPPHVMVFPR